jgi:WD40 repeat protein
MKKKLTYFLLAVITLNGLTSCQDKTKNYLVKKWDCVQVENLAPLDKHFISKEDSIVAVKMEAALTTLSWTFNNDNTYYCTAFGNRKTVQGTYEISEDEKILILTPFSKNNINAYTITSISDIELTLTSRATTVPLVLHFSPH